MIATASVATVETDARLAQSERAKGAKAKAEGKPRESCPWDNNSLIAGWWFEGYDDPYAGLVGAP